jgi:hypothetical protein
MTQPPNPASAAVEVFSEQPVMSVLGLIKLGMGLVLLGAGLFGTGSGRLMVMALGLGLAGFGAYDLRKVLDRRVQVRLDESGITALQWPGLHLAWAEVARAEYIPPAGSSAMIRFHLTPEARSDAAFNPLALGGAFQLGPNGARFLQIDVSPLSEGQSRIFGAVARFAPSVPVQNWPR